MTPVRVAVVGAGFAGLGAAIRLKQHGIDDFLVFERAGEVGGTWRDNTYPGCACDIPAHLYSYSFAGHPAWSRRFSAQPEIWRYLRGCVDRFGVDRHLRLRHEVHAACWDGPAGQWVLDTAGGRYTAAVLVLATGPLSEPAVPPLPGLATFAGTVFHSARWDHRHDLTGRRVAVVGTGASAVQFVPEIAPRVGRLHVFQRTAPWVLPRGERLFGRAERLVYARVPGARRAARAALYWGHEWFGLGFRNPPLMRLTQRLAERHLRRSVPDPALRARLTPDYPLGCKRILLSDTYLTALTRPNVEVVTEPIGEVRPDAVVTRDGAVRAVDTLILGTGFRVTDAPVGERVRGRDGRSLAEAWRGSPQAYLGITVTGFPNLFMLLGPNTGLGHTSVVLMAEYQIRYLLAALEHLRRSGVPAVEPRPEAQREFIAAVDRRMSRTVWVRGGCQSWYRDRTGRVSTLWPASTMAYRWRLRRFDPAAYRAVG